MSPHPGMRSSPRGSSRRRASPPSGVRGRLDARAVAPRSFAPRARAGSFERWSASVAIALATVVLPLGPSLLPAGVAQWFVGLAHAAAGGSTPSPKLAPRCDPERLASMSAEGAARDEEARALAAGLAVACDASAFDDGVDPEGGGVCDASGRSMVAPGRVRAIDPRASIEAFGGGARCASGLSDASGRCVERSTLRCAEPDAEHASARVAPPSDGSDAPTLDLHEHDGPGLALVTALSLRWARSAPTTLESPLYRLVVARGASTTIERPPRAS